MDVPCDDPLGDAPGGRGDAAVAVGIGELERLAVGDQAGNVLRQHLPLRVALRLHRRAHEVDNPAADTRDTTRSTQRGRHHAADTTRPTLSSGKESAGQGGGAGAGWRSLGEDDRAVSISIKPPEGRAQLRFRYAQADGRRSCSELSKIDTAIAVKV